jgi:hypothetical protein
MADNLAARRRAQETSTDVPVVTDGHGPFILRDHPDPTPTPTLIRHRERGSMRSRRAVHRTSIAVGDEPVASPTNRLRIDLELFRGCLDRPAPVVTTRAAEVMATGVIGHGVNRCMPVSPVGGP